MDEDTRAKLRAHMGDDEFERFMFESRAPDVLSTLAFARVRCMTFGELLASLPQIDKIENGNLIVARFCELDLDARQQWSLVPVLKSLADEAETLPSKQKATIERYIRRLVRQLGPQAAADVAGSFFDHKRRARRQIAFDVFRHVGITPALAERLVTLYEQHGDQEYLELIARCPDALNSVDPSVMLEELEDKYWRARVIQGLLEQRAEHITEIAERYPCEFAHAVGRTRDQAHLPIILNVFRANRKDLEFLSIFTWCLGVLGAKDRLNLIEGALAEVSESLTKGCRTMAGSAPGALDNE